MGMQGHQTGHGKNENLVELVNAGEFGQVWRWVKNIRWGQTAEVSQQKC